MNKSTQSEPFLSVSLALILVAMNVICHCLLEWMHGWNI